MHRLPAPQASPKVSQDHNPTTHTTGAQPPTTTQTSTHPLCVPHTHRRPQAKPRHTQTATHQRHVRGEADATGVRLSLVHMEDPSFTGSAFVDTEYGVVTEFETPAQRLVVRDLGRLPR